MKKNIFIAFLLSSFLLSPSSMKAQSPREEFKQNIYKSGRNYYAYPGPEQQRLTPAPKGYTPYYISHYGCHGSRYLIGKSDYDRAWSVLLRADSLGKLTDYGKDVLRRVILLRNEADQRRGELTLLGAEQHRDILVKALLNENEATLPLKPVTGPYYKWTDFRDYFTRKLANFKLAD